MGSDLRDCGVHRGHLVAGVEAQMSWKGWLAIVAVILVVFVALTYVNRQRWVARDVERQMQIERLQQEAEQHGKDAQAAARKVADAKRAAQSTYQSLQEKEAELDALRDKVGLRLRPAKRERQDAEALAAQLVEADELIFALEGSLSLAHQTIDSLHLALDAAEDQSTALELQVAANEEAWLLERERSDTWQQQTKRGRVKTAFLAIGATAAGGLAGYGIGAATQ